MSLISGGLFDITNNWGRPHVSHREGYNADIEFWSADCQRLDDEQRETLEDIVLKVTKKSPVCESNDGVVDCSSPSADRYHLNRR
jgi:hypothetical protein